MGSVEELQRENARLREENTLLRAQRDEFEEMCRALRARIFGKKAERFPDHPTLPFPEEDLPTPPHVDEAPDDECEEEPPQEPKKKRKGKPRSPRLSPKLERVEQVIEPTEEQRACSCCGKPREIIGYETTEKLLFRPACFQVLEIRRPKLACPKHEEAGVVTPELPPQVIDKGIASESMLAQVITAKYRDHLPLYRQAGIYRRSGVEIPESTLGDWIRVSSELLRPIVDAMHARVLRSRYIATDDTSITVCGLGKKKGSKRAFLWAYAGDRGEVVFDFTMGRSRDGPSRMLEGFEGHLQADAFSGYKPLFEDGRILEVGCMAHARRRFFDAQATCEEHAKTALGCLGHLYAIERDIADLEPEERHNRRQAESAPLFDDFAAWVRQLGDHVLPKSPIGKAVTYFRNNEKALRRYLDDPALRIDNNRTERAMRQVAVGRKNWLFAGSPAGGERAATLYSLTVSCWELGIDPFEYLSDVLVRLHDTPSDEVDSLTPRQWKLARDAAS